MKVAALIFAGLTASILASPSAHGQVSSNDNSALSWVGSSTLQYIAPDDTDQEIIQKASKLLPRPNQSDWSEPFSSISAQTPFEVLSGATAMKILPSSTLHSSMQISGYVP
jgi:hypothetical protein